MDCILFRGKAISNNEWVEGDLIQADNRTFIADDWIIEGSDEDYTTFDCGQLNEVYFHTVC